MNTQTFTNISKIIERDSKATTYKFALLRGVIDIVQDDSPYIEIAGDKVYFPLGLMVEKWLIYYYPLTDIPQINGDTQLAFQNQLKTVVNYYNSSNGISGLYSGLRGKGISPEIENEFIALVKKLQETISKMPMRYIGKSVTNAEYSIFQYTPSKTRSRTEKLDLQWLIDSCGTFSIPLEYYEAFRVLGSFISGSDSIIFKWADFSVAASGKNLSTEEVVSEILKSPITERDILVSKSLYKAILQSSGEVECVWSGNKTRNYDIDHMIPFSVWRNNDLWNLLPVLPKVNNQKRDKIPSLQTLDKRKDIIIHYWETIHQKQENRFLSELQIALLGVKNFTNWQNSAFAQLKQTCSNLINVRGYEEWNL